MSLKFSLAFLLSILLTSQVQAASTLVLTPGRETYSIDSRMELLVDPDQSYTIGQVASDQLSDMFFPHQGTAPNFGFTSAAYWLRFSIINENPDHRWWILALDSAVVDEVEFFLMGPDGLLIYQVAGDAVPRGERKFVHRLPVFNFQAEPGRKLTCYLRLTCDNCSLSAPLALWTESAFWRHDRMEGIYYGVYIGCIAGLMLYNLFFFVALRERNYLFLFLFLLLFIFWQVHRQGWAYEFLGSAWPWWNNQAVLLFMGLGLFWGAFFMRQLLGSQEATPTLDRLFVIVMVAGLIVAAISFVVFRWANILGHLAGVLLILLILPSSLIGAFKGDRTSRFVLAAWLFFALGAVVSGLAAPHFFSDWLANAHRIGLVAAAALLSLSLTEQSLLRVRQSGDSLALEMESRSRDLKESVRRFNALVESARHPVYILNLEARFDFITPEVENKLGYDPSDLVGRHFPSLIHHEDVDRFTDTFWKLTAGQIKTTPLEFRCRHDNGTWHWLLTAPTAVPDDQGQTMYVLGELYDITNEKEHGDALGEVQKRLDMALDALQGDLWKANLRSKTILFQQAEGLRSLGYAAADIPLDLKSFFSLVHPDDLPGFTEALKNPLPEESGYYYARFRLKAKSGRYLQYHAVWQALSWDMNAMPLELKGLFYVAGRVKEAVIR